MSTPRKVSESTIRRISSYLRILKDTRGERTMSSERLAELGGVTSAQVRKDLSFFGNFGVRGRGYDVQDLQGVLSKILGLDRTWKTVVIGAGRLGSALSSYPEFASQGFHIVGVFDTDPAKLGRPVGNRRVLGLEQLEAIASQEHVAIGIIATPASAAQESANRLVSAGIRGILNFAPATLDVPETVSVRHVNLAIELEGLSFAISEAENRENGGSP